MEFEQELQLVIVSVTLGGIIGLMSSITMFLIQRYIDTKGKVLIFYKKTFVDIDKDVKGGFSEKDSVVDLSIPLVFEFQNTTNTTKVIRDISLFLYKNGKKLNKTYQINFIKKSNSKGGKITKEEKIEFGSEKNSYSFVIPQHSIQKQYCYFGYFIQKEEIQNNIFDEIRLRYFNENNKEKVSKFMKIENCWRIQNFEVDNEWRKL